MSSVAVTNGKPNTSEDNDKDADDDKQSGSDKPAQEMTLPQFMTAAMSGIKGDYSELKTAIFGAVDPGLPANSLVEIHATFSSSN